MTENTTQSAERRARLFDEINEALDRSGGIVEVCRAAASRLPNAAQGEPTPIEFSMALGAARRDIDRIRSLIDELQQ